MVNAVLVTFLLFGAAPSQNAQARTPIHVFTQTDASGFVDADTAARLKTVADTRKALASSKRLILVDTPDAATITIEIKGTSAVDEPDAGAALANSLDRLAGGLKAAGANRSETKKVTHRHATLRVGTAYSTELDVAVLGWKSVANAIESWAKQNQAQLQR